MQKKPNISNILVIFWIIAAITGYCIHSFAVQVMKGPFCLGEFVMDIFIIIVTLTSLFFSLNIIKNELANIHSDSNNPLKKRKNISNTTVLLIIFWTMAVFTGFGIQGFAIQFIRQATPGYELTIWKLIVHSFIVVLSLASLFYTVKHIKRNER